MGKRILEYSSSLKNQLTLRLMLPFLLCYALLYTTLMISCLQLSTKFSDQVEIERDRLNVEKNKSLFTSKGNQIGNLFQMFVNDLQIQKLII